MMQPLTPEQVKLLEDYQKSGMKKKVFCQNIGIALHKLDYVIYKDQRLNSSGADLVKFQDIASTSTSLKIDLKDLTIIIEPNFDENLLRKVIMVLRS